MSTILNLREKEKDYKRQIREAADLKTRLDVLEAEKLSDEEKQAKLLTELQAEKVAWAAERQNILLGLAVQKESRTVGIQDADIALALLDRSQVEYDDDGAPTNLAALLEALAEAKPLLKGITPAVPAVPSINAGNGHQQGPTPQLRADELQAAAETGMTPDRFEAMKHVTSLADFEKLQASATQ